MVHWRAGIGGPNSVKTFWTQILTFLGLAASLSAALYFARYPQAAPTLTLPTLALSNPFAIPASVEPRWVRPPAPTAADYPAKALRAAASGEAIITCRVSPRGRPTDCEIESETPSGLGFGPAARRIVERGQLTRPVLEDDQTVGPRFTVRVPFTLD